MIEIVTIFGTLTVSILVTLSVVGIATYASRAR